MSRVSANKEIIELVGLMMDKADATTEEKMLGSAVLFLKDISISMATIADALHGTIRTREENR